VWATSEDVTGDWRRLHEELHNLQSSSNIILVIKSQRMRWAQHVACMGERRSASRILVRKILKKENTCKP
jgi:hypothetical protein